MLAAFPMSDRVARPPSEVSGKKPDLHWWERVTNPAAPEVSGKKPDYIG